jgi:uncharacterized SAM-binding protein YcdF (DUF218 family)
VFVELSKLLDLLLDPAAVAVALGLAALALGRWRPRAAAGAGLLAVAVLWAFSTPVVADSLQRVAERPARDTSAPGVTYDAVVVLSGAMSSAATEASGRFELDEGADRLVRAFELLRAGRARYALLTGGAVERRAAAPRESELAARVLAGWGIEPDRIVVEAESRNTRENAVESARVVRERGWARLLLVTSAAHMPRALGCFRAVGLSPDALPVDRRAGKGEYALRSLAPRARSLSTSARVLRELAGRVVYRALGYSR